MPRQNGSNGHLSVKQPNQNKLNKSSKLRQETQDDNDTTALFQHSPETKQLEREYEAGCLPDEVYDRQLPAWRAGLRRFLIRCLKVESEWLAHAQSRIRGQFLDRYFYWTALFGTHTFFMAVLPMFFWFADDFHARGLLVVTGLGIWLSSFAKDLACCPRPYSPPVIRLSMSTHGLEYGFPSSHSANSVSMALFLGTWLTMRFTSGEIDAQTLVIGRFALAVYALSVILGRLYCGMHSIVDCSAGAVIGWISWFAWDRLQAPFEAWLVQSDWKAPLAAIFLCGCLVHYHPEPVDDCPCFEDAIAILSAILGSTLSHWFNSHYRPHFKHGFQPGHTPFGLTGSANTAAQVVFGLGKLVIGISALFLWRMVMKRLLHSILPIIFRTVAHIFHFALPTRRHYQAATDYDKVPTPYSLNPLPSFVDLPSQASLTTALPPSLRLQKRSTQALNESFSSSGSSASQQAIESAKPPPKRMEAETRHYDVTVLTKVIVYAGIPIMAIDPVRMVYVLLENLIGKPNLASI